MSQLADLKADLEARGEDCKRMTSEIEELVRGADRASQDGVELFDKVSGQLARNLQLASRLAKQLGGGGDSSRAADSDSSLATEISGHLENLERLISQIVDLGKLQSSNGQIVRTEVKVKDLLHDCVERVRASADQSGIKVSVQAAKDLPKVSVDRRLVARAVDELVANAVVYTNPGGRITVRALLDGDEAGTDILRLTVQDNGQGMTRAEQESILEPFVRGEHPRLSLSGAGAGLGLALAKGYVNQLGGDIAVESKHGKGSTFTIKVPVDVVS
jgi:two-component system sensor histidine kinase SenX3